MKWYKLNINDVSEKDYQIFLGLMTDEKREKVLKFKQITDRKLAVCGEILARTAISEITGKTKEELVFELKKSGKPFCKNAETEFSISHSGEFAVCAVSEKPVGIDIQKITEYNEKTAERVCSEEELYAIRKSAQKSREFIKIWTKKEAVLKRDEKSIFSPDIKTCLKGECVKTFEFSDYFVSISE